MSAAMLYQQALRQQELQKTQQKQSVAPTPSNQNQQSQVTQQTASPVPRNPSSPVIQESSGKIWLREDYHVANKEVVNTGEGQVKTTYTFQPVSTPAPAQSSVPTPLITQGYIPPAKTVFGTEPIINTPEKLGTAFTVTTIAATPVLGGAGLTLNAAKTVATQAVIGAGLNVGISQGVKAVSGGGLLTPTEVATAAVTGAIIAPLSGKINSILGLTGRSAAQSVARVGLGAGLGAGVSAGAEYAETRQITATNVLVGAGTGAAFAGLGEALPRINAKYGITEKVQSKLISNQSTLEQLDIINTKYETAYRANEMYSPTLKEKFVMKTTGLSPMKPAPQILETPTIPTANPASYETYMGTKEVSMDIFAYNNKGVPVDRFQVKDIIDAPMIREKPSTSLSYRSMIEEQLKTKTATAAELADAGTIIYGKSVPPETYYAKAKPVSKTKLPTYGLKEGEFTELSTPDALSFVKTEKEIRLERLKTKANTLTDLTNNADLFTEIPASDMSTTEATAISKARTNVKAQSPKEVMAELNSDWVSEKSEVGLSSQKTLVNQKVNNTVIDNMVSDIVQGNVVDTSRRATMANPFMYGGVSYYKQQPQIEETETVYLSYPKTGLSQPTGIKEKSMGAVGVTPLSRLDVGNVGLLNPQITFNTPIMATEPIQNVGITPDMASGMDVATVTKPPFSTPETFSQPKIIDETTITPMLGAPSFPMLGFPGEFKFESGGFNLPNWNIKQKGRKNIRYYPVVDPLETFEAFF